MAPRTKKATPEVETPTGLTRSTLDWLDAGADVDVTAIVETADSGDTAVEGAPGIAPCVKSGRILIPSIMATKAFAELQKAVDKVESNLDFFSQQHNIGGFIEDSIPTGCLSYDFAMGGGLPIGKFISHAGPEQSGKSTLFNTIVPWAVHHNMPVYWFDPESARDPDYADRIFNRFGISLLDIQGRRSRDGKGWDVLPMVRYTNHHIGEDIFNAIAATLLALPEVKKDHNGQWWEREHEGSWVERANGSTPQYLFLIDSFPAMLPELVQESLQQGDDKSGAIGIQARMFSDNLKKVKAALTSRRCILLGNNQLRMKPMAMGNPVVEPGGEALKFYSDGRFHVTRVSPSTAGAKRTDGGSTYNEETSITGGIDKYTYSKLANKKNKMYTPYRDGAMRIRMEHDGRPGDGIDITYDTLQYLDATGQLIKVHGGKFKLEVRGVTASGEKPSIYGANFSDTSMPYMTLKTLIEAPENKQGLWKHCLRQIRTGYAFEIEQEMIDRADGRVPEASDMAAVEVG
jgi:RecA/RadA recombinase